MIGTTRAIRYRQYLCALLALLVAMDRYSTLRAAPPLGRKFAVLVGIQNYHHRALRKLAFPENDVVELGDLLRNAGYKVVLLTNHQPGDLEPTLLNIQAQLHGCLEKAKEDDTVLIGLAGHGLQFSGEEDAYFCPMDARPSDTGKESLLSLAALYRVMDRSDAGVKLLLVDACRDDPRSGRGPGIRGTTAPRPPKGVAALFSCSRGETAYESEKIQHGVFFHFVIKGLRGEATNEDNEVTWSRLTEFVQKRVVRETPTLIGYGATQTPALNTGELSGESPVLVALARESLRPKVQPHPHPPIAPEAQSVEQEVEFEYSFEGNSRRGKTLLLALDVGANEKLELIRIPAGNFIMGSPASEADRWENETKRNVTLTKDFYLGKYPVTQAQYRAVMRSSPSHFSGDRLPVENVSWTDAQQFCRLASAKTGRNLVLPTEAQWEYACRAGTRTPFHFGSVLNGDLANCNGNTPYGTPTKGGYRGRTTEVGTYPPNAFGLYDMHGNVWQWCKDWFGEYPPGDATDPPGHAGEEQRVIRGGSWRQQPCFCRAAFRNSAVPMHRDSEVGFRIAAFCADR